MKLVVCSSIKRKENSLRLSFVMTFRTGDDDVELCQGKQKKN